MFRTTKTKKENNYSLLVIVLSILSFLVSGWIGWFYIMAFLLFLGPVMFGKPTKKSILYDSAGLLLLWLIIFVGGYLF